MKKVLLLIISLILFNLSSAFADGPVTWEPESPVPGDTITIYYDPSIGTLTGNNPILLHWGVDEEGHGNWKQPPEELWPPGSAGWPDGKAIQSPMTQNNEGIWWITIQTTDTTETVHFVFTDGGSWDNNAGANWDIILGEEPGPSHTYEIGFNLLVDMANAITNRGFTYGDTLLAKVGYFNTANDLTTVTLQRQGFSSFYAGSGNVTTTEGIMLDYGYFAIKNGKENMEVFYNFDYEGDNQGEAQRRQVKVTGSSVSVADSIASNSDPHRMPFFRNLSVIARDVLVTLTCDVRPAIVQLLYSDKILEDIQGDINIGDPDSVMILGVAVNGPITGSWSNDEGPDWGSHLMGLDNKRMYDDGTHGDVVAGDSIFTAQFQFYRDSSDVIGQEFKFGIGGGDNEGGYGNNHVDNIDDSQPTATISAQFGSIDPTFYNSWDYDKRMVSGVNLVETNVPHSYTLEQNYPNPFNPSTTIKYTMAKGARVSIKVYNINGQLVTTLIDTWQPQGHHFVKWLGKDDSGKDVTSGMYLVKMITGDFSKVNKMMLIR